MTQSGKHLRENEQREMIFMFLGATRFNGDMSQWTSAEMDMKRIYSVMTTETAKRRAAVLELCFNDFHVFHLKYDTFITTISNSKPNNSTYEEVSPNSMTMRNSRSRFHFAFEEASIRW
jgi:hypothetical protein